MPFQKVLAVSTTTTPKGKLYLLELSCGHTKKVTPLDDPRDYARAPRQKRASCKQCGGVLLTTEKECFGCKAKKPIEDFYRSRGCFDGRQKRCKECQIEYMRQLYKGRPIRSKAAALYKARNLAKYEARKALQNAVAIGKMVKPESCEECGIEANLHGHHDDYSKPLDVRWLCPPCHMDWHRLYGDAKS